MREKLNSLTGMRFFAAAMIVIHHTSWMYDSSRYIESLVHTDYGVTFFYVLSGFILYYTYGAMDTRTDMPRFVIARVARIWPLHLATMLSVLILFSPPWGYPGQAPALVKIGLNATLLHAWIPSARYFFSLNGPSWSLSVELFFYISFPFLLMGWKKNWWMRLAATVAVGIATVSLADRLHLPSLQYGDPDLGWSVWIPMAFPILRAPEFLLGMIAGMFWFTIRDRTASAPPAIWTCAEIVALAVAAWALSFLPYWVEVLHYGPIATAWLTRCAGAPAFGLLIVVFAFGRGGMSGLMGSRPMVLLGEISFSIYMTHEILARLIVSRFPVLMFKGNSWEGFTLFWLVDIGISLALWAYIEKPYRKAIVDWFDRRLERKEALQL